MRGLEGWKVDGYCLVVKNERFKCDYLLLNNVWTE